MAWYRDSHTQQFTKPLLNLVTLMGEFRFRIPEFWDFEARHARTVHVVGIDGIPRPCNVKHLDNLLIVTRNQNESGRTYISFPFRTKGELTVCTGTLPESSEPYSLVVELARGTINRLRNQTSIWQEGGLEIPNSVRRLTNNATSNLGKSITGSTVDSENFARDGLDCAMDAIFELSNHFGKEISEFRVNEPEIPTFWLACSYVDKFAQKIRDQKFDLLSLSIDQALTIKNGLGSKVIVGPLLDASPLSSFSTDGDDFNSSRLRLLNKCDIFLDDIPSGTTLIHAACNLNGIGHKNLSYRQQVQLTTELISRIDDAQGDVPVMISFDYPWAERLAWSVGGIHPLQIAEDIMRNGTRLSFIGLDINLDYWPCGSVSRDPFQWIDMIDLWSQLGLPLILCLRVPQSVSLEEFELPAAEFVANPEENVTIAMDSADTSEIKTEQEPVMANSVRENLTENQRMELLKTILPMAVARPGVHGILWRQWNDAQDNRFPHAGIVDDFAESKATSNAISHLRSQVLRR